LTAERGKEPELGPKVELKTEGDEVAFQQKSTFWQGKDFYEKYLS
jgi:hypothetical protein